VKKPYVKGSIKRVQLRPDEAVLIMCKSTIEIGAFQSGVSCIGLPGEQCFSDYA
jgi:hypothetical protein